MKKVVHLTIEDEMGPISVNVDNALDQTVFIIITPKNIDTNYKLEVNKYGLKKKALELEYGTYHIRAITKELPITLQMQRSFLENF